MRVTEKCAACLLDKQQKLSNDPDFLRDSDLHSFCPWKGRASYHTLEVDGKLNVDAAWFYPETTGHTAP